MIYAFWLLVFLTGEFTPWWSACLLAVLIGFFGKSARNAFFSGASGLMITGLTRAYYSDMRLQASVSEKISALFSLPGPWTSYLVVLMVSGLLGGFFCWFGFELSGFYKKFQNNS